MIREECGVSVLISVYHKENPSFLYVSLRSIANQTTPPQEIIVVKDGLLTPELDEVIAQRSEKSSIQYRVIEFEINAGLGKALNEGVKYCSHEWIARMDTDDIALPNRFEKQVDYIQNHPDTDIVGGWICEFDHDEKACEQERRVPKAHEEIEKFARYRNPMNHMTVMFKKSAVEEAGGYQPMNGFEDYYLWMRMLIRGKRFANIPEVLVKARIGSGMIERRRGWCYLKDEWHLEKAAYRLGFWRRGDLVRNLFYRMFPRVLPRIVVEKLYNLLRKF